MKLIRCVSKVLERGIVLTGEVKLTDFGAAPPKYGMSKEDERSVELAERAQKGDYDDGRLEFWFALWGMRAN